MRVPLLMLIHVSTTGSRIVFDGAGDNLPRGYYQTIGATTDDSRDLYALVKEYVAGDTGGQLLEIEDVRPAELDGRDADIHEVCGDPSVRGVWYSSGRAFYSDDDDTSADTEADE